MQAKSERAAAAPILHATEGGRGTDPVSRDGAIRECRVLSGLPSIQVVLNETGAQHMGLLTQITPNRELRVCGPGFNERTVQVRIGGAAYFVFREDLDRAGFLEKSGERGIA